VGSQVAITAQVWHVGAPGQVIWSHESQVTLPPHVLQVFAAHVATQVFCPHCVLQVPQVCWPAQVWQVGAPGPQVGEQVLWTPQVLQVMQVACGWPGQVWHDAWPIWPGQVAHVSHVTQVPQVSWSPHVFSLPQVWHEA
jgi:hypothetical protein